MNLMKCIPLLKNYSMSYHSKAENSNIIYKILGQRCGFSHHWSLGSNHTIYDLQQNCPQGFYKSCVLSLQCLLFCLKNKIKISLLFWSLSWHYSPPSTIIWSHYLWQFISFHHCIYMVRGGGGKKRQEKGVFTYRKYINIYGLLPPLNLWVQ